MNLPEHFERGLKNTSKPILRMYDHSNIMGHHTSIGYFHTVGREVQNFTRTIKESIIIRVNDPSLNRNIGQYQLPHIWDEVLFNTPELKLK